MMHQHPLQPPTSPMFAEEPSHALIFEQQPQMWQVSPTDLTSASWWRTVLFVCSIVSAWAIVLFCRLCVRVYWKSWLNLPGE